jgi:hypothetical protein
MKTKTTFAIFMAIVAGQSLAQTLTATDIVEKSITASGGREAYAKQKSLIMKADMNLGETGLKGEMVTYQKGAKILVTTSIAGVGDMVQGFDGKIAWANDPMNGLRKLDGEERDAFIRSSSNSTMNYKTAFKTVQLVGSEKVNDRDCYIIKFSPAKGEPVKQYIDKETFLVSRLTMKAKSASQDISVDVTMSDYKSVEGVMVPYTSKVSTGPMDILVKVTSVKVNVAIDDSKFAYPSTKPAK